MNVKTELIEKIAAMDEEDIFLRQVYDLFSLHQKASTEETMPAPLKKSMAAARKRIEDGDYLTAGQFRTKYAQWLTK